jgi:hypothetical protein
MYGVCIAAGEAEMFLFAIQNEQFFHQFILDLSFIVPSSDLTFLVQSVQSRQAADIT